MLGIIIRTVGLVLLAASLYYLAPILYVIVYFRGSAYEAGYVPLVGALLNVAASVYLLRGAPLLLNFAYPKKELPPVPPRPDGKTAW